MKFVFNRCAARPPALSIRLLSFLLAAHPEPPRARFPCTNSPSARRRFIFQQTRRRSNWNPLVQILYDVRFFARSTHALLRARDRARSSGEIGQRFSPGTNLAASRRSADQHLLLNLPHDHRVFRCLPANLSPEIGGKIDYHRATSPGFCPTIAAEFGRKLVGRQTQPEFFCRREVLARLRRDFADWFALHRTSNQSPRNPPFAARAPEHRQSPPPDRAAARGAAFYSAP